MGSNFTGYGVCVHVEKYIFYKTRIDIILCFENVYHEQLQIEFKKGYRIIG